MDTTEQLMCPICGKQDLSDFLVCLDHYASKEPFRLVQCACCGFVQTSNPPNEKVIGCYYETPDYISHSDTQKGIVNKIYHRVRQITLERKARLVTKHTKKKHGKLLDVGCGTGYFGATMQNKEWKVYGIERNEKAAEAARSKFGFNVFSNESLQTFPSDEFDAITLWHVLEHLSPLDKTMENFRRLLTKDGILVLALPNRLSHDALHYNANWAAYDVPRHLWHFTETDIAQLAENNRFQIIKQYPMPFDSFYISILSEKYKESKAPFLKGFYHGFITWLKSLLSSSQSSSIIYVLKKQS